MKLDGKIIACFLGVKNEAQTLGMEPVELFQVDLNPGPSQPLAALLSASEARSDSSHVRLRPCVGFLGGYTVS